MSTKKYNTTRKNSANSNHNGNDELEDIARKMNEICKRRLPDRVIRSGSLQGLEPEIRQAALIMAVGGFLQKNTDYLDARQKQDEDAIQNSMEKCAAITLGICKTRMGSRLNSFHRCKVPITESNGGTCRHRTQLSPAEWPADIQARVIMQAVGKAVRSGKLSVANASMMSMVCEYGMPVVEVARVWNISRSAAYQQIVRVRSVIPDFIDEIEEFLL